MNQPEMSKETVNRLLAMAGSNPKLQQNLKKGNLEGALGCLSPQDAKAVRSVLGNPGQLSAILSSPEAKKLMEQLGIKK